MIAKTVGRFYTDDLYLMIDAKGQVLFPAEPVGTEMFHDLRLKGGDLSSFYSEVRKGAQDWVDKWGTFSDVPAGDRCLRIAPSVSCGYGDRTVALHLEVHFAIVNKRWLTEEQYDRLGQTGFVRGSYTAAAAESPDSFA